MANDPKYLYVLGVNNFANSEASASLLRVPRNGEGEMDYVCIGEDRLTRLKHTYLFPLRGIDYCLKHFGLESLDQVDYLATDYARVPRWHNSGPAYRKLEHDYLKLMLRFPRDRIIVTDHHKCHVASCYYPSGFDEAGVLIVDGMGSELMTQSAYRFKGNRIDWEEKGYDWGIGRVYSFVSKDVLPYGPEKGYGKVMGLAAYGQDDKEQALRFEVKEQGLTTDYSAFHSRNPVPRLQARDIPQCTNRQDAMNPPFPRAAFDVQAECERQLVRMAQYIHEKTGTKRLCISGGVALNGRGNYKILKETPIQEVWVQPGCSDTGISFGAALWAYYQVINPGERKCRVSMRHAYSGTPYSKDEIERTLSRYGVQTSQTSPREIAQHLAGKKIVAFFEGASEFGPRALGHRSILADPRDPEMKDKLNSSVKFREGYRPYAPVILREDVSEYFDLDCPSPFMLLVADVRKDKYSVIPSVTHVDGTARVQTVTKEDNGTYYEIVREFKNITGVPVLIDTSFNINREPIVETPIDALICAFGTSIDYLVLEDRLIDCRHYRSPELIKRLEADRKETLDLQYQEMTRKYLHRHDKEEMARYFDEENKIANWHREYRSKYELEKAMAEWARDGSRVLIAGTRLHTKCLYLYIADFPQVNVTGFIAMDQEPGERDAFNGVYPECGLDSVNWNEVDAILISSHEYQRKIAHALEAHPQARLKPRTEIYDSAGDSLIYVLPERWPVMNPAEAAKHGLSIEATGKRTASNIDFDYEPTPIQIGERYGVWVAYPDARPAGSGELALDYGVGAETFAQQVRTLKENFAFATGAQLVDPKAALPEAVVNLSFDHGLREFMERIAPVLEDYQVPASVFLCSRPYLEGRVLAEHKIELLARHWGWEAFGKKFNALVKQSGSPKKESPEYAKNLALFAQDAESVRSLKMDLHHLLPYDSAWPALDRLFTDAFGADAEQRAVKALYLSTDDLKRLSDRGIEIGIRNHDGKILCRLDYEGQKKSLKACKEFITELTGIKGLTAAYPQGFSNNHTKRALKELGILAGFSLERRMITPPDIKARWSIPRYTVADCFEASSNKINHPVFASLSTGD